MDAKTKLPLILSRGMSDLSEIDQTINTKENKRTGDIIHIHVFNF